MEERPIINCSMETLHFVVRSAGFSLSTYRPHEFVTTNTINRQQLLSVQIIPYVYR